MFSLIATHVIKPEHRDAYIAATMGDAAGSIRNEPGCFQFHVHNDQTQSNVFYLVEVYTDKAAFDYHLTTPHFLKWHNTVKDWFVSENVLWCNTLIPDNPLWKDLKELSKNSAE
jgi:quinol monooxygenase YgiN